MNIKEAKTEIKHTLLAYNRKDANGRYLYSKIRQRPVLLIGPPGIGKTAIMAQVAEECGVGLVAYTITHHTRQSAIGLPHIENRVYAGQELTVTEYTMSEIIASVYQCMEETGKKEGILFIDEINCVSETLAPTMLQFLQNKTFGSHKVPEGWLIAAAGNPPEYNKSVRDFDIVTLDRVRKIEIKEDLEAWEEYARGRKVHPVILSYLAVHRENFYLIENTVDGKFFVTARGWEDLSELLKSYEELLIPVTWELVMEFLQKEEIARDFAAYYRLFVQYGKDYRIREILEGRLSEEEKQKQLSMLEKAGFEERITVTELFLSGLFSEFQSYKETEHFLTCFHAALKKLKSFLEKQEDIQEGVKCFLAERERLFIVKTEKELMTEREEAEEKRCLICLGEILHVLQGSYLHDKEEGWNCVQVYFEGLLEQRKKLIEGIKVQVERTFAFFTESCGDGHEIVLLVSVLSRNADARSFFSQNESEAYLKYSEKLLYREREKELQKACAEVAGLFIE